jgi:hypothetical protein
LFNSRFLLAAIAVALLFGGFNRAPAQASKQPAKKLRARLVLETFPVAPSGGLRYEISLASCAQSTCPFQVRLIEGNRVYGTLNLDWRGVPAEPVQAAIDASLGAGDPLQKRWEGKAWETGIESRNVSLTARGIALTPQLNGVLVHQRAGFEHLKRRHYLFVAVGRKLARAWTGSEGQGPTWSTVELSEPRRDGSQDFIYFTGFQYPGDEEPDSMEFAIHRWNARKNQLEKAPASESASPVVALIAGTYGAVAEARKAIGQHPDCLKDFLVLGADSLPQTPKGQFAVAALTTKAALADREMARCAPALKIKTVKLSHEQ